MSGSTDEDQPHEVVRDANGRWIVPPRSPGRPRGLSHSEKLRALLEPEREALIGRLLALTRDDDPHASARAVEIALRYLGPPPRPEAERIVVPGLAEAKTLHDRAAAVVAAVADGAVSPEAGQKVLQMLDVLNRTAKTADLEARIAALEGRKAEAIEHAPPADADCAGLL